MAQLVAGVHKFQRDEFGDYRKLFRKLSQEGENPHMLFINCSDYYTIPIQYGLYTVPGIQVIRSTSFCGLSFVRIVFNYGVDYNFAYSQAANWPLAAIHHLLIRFAA